MFYRNLEMGMGASAIVEVGARWSAIRIFWQKWVLLPYPLRFVAFGGNYQVARIYLPWSRLLALLAPLDGLFFGVVVFVFMLAALFLKILSVAYGKIVEPVGIGLPGPDSRRR